MSWIDLFTGLADLEGNARDLLEARSQVLRVPEGTTVFGPGREPDSLLLLLDGTVRVQKISETGREIVLYRVKAGESCVLTTACLLGQEEYAAEGVTETAVEAAAIPRPVFDELIAGSDAFRRFVFDNYSRRITDLFMVIEEVAFRRMDIRLAQRLLDLAQDGTVKATHQKLAAELGTAREVVSRQLAEFHRRGWIEQARGTIEITDRAAIAGIAATAA
ncbi:Crp/Fnr family transcriptional regulator [Tropicimonas sediminicola]|uniref:Cyclic nucleotide-binding protein n=1 Tax=Tropicimonas sediminicola TaxID=1031541 RepID=A0A239C829_9RHOB|nr:Crp/Fnr family transcriptional regulator [Tropicimonas sediminicola]SNS16386.1 cyclic nucleotide-binding protein [Tropicimonas sediminicola]